MESQERPAAPESGPGNDNPHIPTFEELAADPEIAPLLAFEPVPRRIEVEGGWSPEKQREFIARLAVHGSKNKACLEMGMHTTGMTKVQNSPGSKGFRAAWEGAVALARKRREEKAAAEFVRPGTKLPTIDHRRKHPHPDPLPRAGEGEVRNEHGEYEDAASLRRRADEARDSVSAKLLRCRRLYLQEISGSPGKRAAFEILTHYPIDWDKAALLEPQDDEPWRKPNMHRPEMLLTAENGWIGDMLHGENKTEELRRALDRHREEQGLPPVNWDGESAESGR